MYTNTPLLLTNTTLTRILDFYMDNILIFTAAIGLIITLIPFIMMPFARKHQKHKECGVIAFAGLITVLISIFGMKIVQHINTVIPELFAGIFAICAVAVPVITILTVCTRNKQEK